MRRVYNVQARWDSEGAKKLRVLIPELLELNGALEAGGEPAAFVVRYEHAESGVAALTS